MKHIELHTMSTKYAMQITLCCLANIERGWEDVAGEDSRLRPHVYGMGALPHAPQHLPSKQEDLAPECRQQAACEQPRADIGPLF